MAISPSIPTSFVPRQPVETNHRKFQAGNNIFLMIALAILGIAFLAAGATYGYNLYLKHLSDAKAAELQKAQAATDQSTVEGFVRLSSRLTNAKQILNSHVLTSQFFDLLETLTLQNVHFSSLTFSLNEDKSATVVMNGVAKSYNALAAQSAAFATDKRIKRAIFSGFTPNKDGSVTFALSADLDPKLVLLNDAAATAAAAGTSVLTPPTTSTTAATTTAPASTAPASTAATSTPVAPKAATSPTKPVTTGTTTTP